jgi:hypothetical protein
MNPVWGRAADRHPGPEMSTIRLSPSFGSPRQPSSNADPSLTRLIVRARRLMRRLAENPGSTLEDIASAKTWAGLIPPACVD